MSVIKKFAILGFGERPVAVERYVDMPDGSIVRAFGYDTDGCLCIWAECDPERDKVARCFVIMGDGQEIPRGLNWIATSEGSFCSDVRHLFEPQPRG